MIRLFYDNDLYQISTCLQTQITLESLKNHKTFINKQFSKVYCDG